MAQPAVGAYLAGSYLALAAGTLVAGWLVDATGRRKPFLLLAGALNLPGLWLLGQATAAWQLVALTATVWFLGGLGLATVSILAGLQADQDQRGQVFGALAVTSSAGSITGGLAVGTVIEGWGYAAMFSTLALTLLPWVLAATLVDDRLVRRDAAASAADRRSGLGVGFWAVFLASLLMATAAFAGVLGRTLLMDQLGFAAVAIAGTAAFAAAVALPVPILGGWLSDHLGRMPPLVASAMLGAAGLVILAGATALWHLWLAMALLAVMPATSTAVGSASVADLVPEASRGRALALLNASTWLGAIVGFVGVGLATPWVGLAATLLVSGGLPLLAAIVLIAVGGTGLARGSRLPAAA